jgi:hypothetical protein
LIILWSKIKISLFSVVRCVAVLKRGLVRKSLMVGGGHYTGDGFEITVSWDGGGNISLGEVIDQFSA